MEFLNTLKNNSLVVCDDITKKQILKELNKEKRIMNITFLTLDSFISKVTFFYDYQALYELMNHYNINYDSAKMYLQNMHLLDMIKDYSLQENKYKNLKEKYDYLLSKGLISFDKLFVGDLKNKQIIIDNSYLNQNNLKIINEKLANLDYKLINFSGDDYDENKLFDCLYFENITSEIYNALEKICDLIDKDKVDINNIKIVLGSDAYLTTCLRTIKDYGLKANVRRITNISSIRVVRKVIELYFNGDYQAIDELRNSFNEELINKTIDCINKYAILKNDSFKQQIIEKDLKNVYKKEEIYDNAIEIVNPSEMKKFMNNDDYHVFVLGFCEGAFPQSFKDEGYFSAKLLLNNGLDTAINLNQIEKKRTIQTLSNIKNLILSVSSRTNFEPLVKSSLINSANLKLEEDITYSNYSPSINKSLYSYRYDKFDKYHEKSKGLSSLAKTYKDEIIQYDNSFTGINQQRFIDDLNGEIKISYSSLDNYYHCPFKYYINDVLRFTQFSSNFSTVIGGAYHEAIELSFDENLNRLDVDPKDIYDKFIKNKENEYKLTISEEYFSSKIREELPNVINTIQDQYKEINYDKAMYEHRVEKMFERNINGSGINIIFKGFIDKLMYSETTENGKTVRHYAVIDYKTGKSTKFEPEYVKYGLSLQLLTYIYFENDELAKNGIEGKVGGFFLQHILTKFPKDDEERRKELAFDGGINLDNDVVKFVNDAKSGIIQKMSSRSNKAEVNSETITEYIDIVDKKTNEAIDNILNAKFDIKPIRVEGKKIKDGCGYCKFMDICFKKFSDYNRIKETIEEKGEENND